MWVLIKSCISFRKRKGDEVDGTDEVAKKKSKKGKDKDSSKLEKALKVSPRLCDRRPPADPAHRDQCTLITERERGLLFP